MTFSRTAFVRMWLLAAVLVATARFLCATRFGYDLSIQIQAAQNLVAGRGLTTYSLDANSDLSKPDRLIALTYFPAGYSLATAALIAIGLTPAVSIKLLGAAATLIGWWGWGRLAYAFIGQRIEHSRLKQVIASFIALTTPVLFTPPWSGTDIFLWAAVPWLLQCLVRPAEKDGPDARIDLVAGAIAGLALLMRYQGLILGGYAALWIILQSLRDWKTLVRRLGSFAAGLFPLLALQWYINHSAVSAPMTPGG
jgi:hypothetical protein